MALLVALGLALTGSVVLAAPAEAATKAYGFQGGSGAGSGWLGNASTHGVLAYCIDEAGVFPSGATTDDGYIGGISATTASADPGHNGTSAVTGSDMQKLNYALTKYGQAATSNRKAAALEAYVYSITSSLYPGNDIEQIIDIRVTDPADAAAVTNAYLAIKADANAHYATPLQTNAATLTITMDAPPALTGTIAVAVTPATATGTMTLTNAVVTATGLPTIAVSDGDAIPITATRLTGNDLYSVRADATFTAPTTWSKDLHEYSTGSPSYSQRLVSGGKIKGESFTATAEDFDPVSPQFQPIVRTTVSSTSVDPGEPVGDEVVASAADSAQPWLRDFGGNYYSVVASGLLYCGMSVFPTTGDTPPDDALVLGPELLTFNGPGTHETDGSLSCPTGGYATWVWSISAVGQSPLTQQALPTAYNWSSNFGDSSETTYARSAIAATSKTSAASVGLNEPTSDILSVTLGAGEWPSDSTGAAVNVRFDGTAFWVLGDSAPSQSSILPTVAQAFATATITATATGDYPGPPVTAPHGADGYVVWRWTTAGGDYTQPWAEDFAEPTQIVSVVAPRMTSSADAAVALSDTASDSVSVTGPTMGEAADLTWGAFKQPLGESAECDATTEVFDSAGSPIEVTEAGTYDLPNPPQFAESGTYLWVASLTSHDGTVIATGACGDPTETTSVIPIGLTTEAVTLASPTTPVGDNAMITGPLPTGATLSFSAYRQTSSNARCDASTLAYSSPRSPLTTVGHVPSPTVLLPQGMYAWTATAVDRDGNVLEEGACGDPAELSRVVPALAYTGTMAWQRAPWIVIGALMSGVAALLWSRRKRLSRAT